MHDICWAPMLPTVITASVDPSSVPSDTQCPDVVAYHNVLQQATRCRPPPHVHLPRMPNKQSLSAHCCPAICWSMTENEQSDVEPMHLSVPEHGTSAAIHRLHLEHVAAHTSQLLWHRRSSGAVIRSASCDGGMTSSAKSSRTRLLTHAPGHDEELADHAGALADVLLHQLRPGHANEGAVRVVRHCPRQQCLARAWRPVQQHPLPPQHSQRSEQRRQ